MSDRWASYRDATVEVRAGSYVTPGVFAAMTTGEIDQTCGSVKEFARRKGEPNIYTTLLCNRVRLLAETEGGAVLLVLPSEINPEFRALLAASRPDLAAEMAKRDFIGRD
jgi:hypothetical protein